VDFLEKCLRWDAAERLTPEQAMAHPWMQDQMTNSPGSFRWVAGLLSTAMQLYSLAT
jgi:serine/threonine protein kinase